MSNLPMVKLVLSKASRLIAAATLVFAATLADAQNVPPGCTSNPDGGYTCPGPGSANGGQANFNNPPSNSPGEEFDSSDLGVDMGSEGYSQDQNGLGEYGQARPGSAQYGSGQYPQGGYGASPYGQDEFGDEDEADQLNTDQLNTDQLRPGPYQSGQRPVEGGAGTQLGRGEGFPGTASPQSNPRAVQDLGLSPDQVSKLKARLAVGPLTADELQQLCVRMASKHLTPSDAQAVIRSLDLNLSADQWQQLQSCTQLAGPNHPAPVLRRQTGINRAARQNLSSVEKSFRSLDRNLRPEEPSTAHLTQFGYSLFSSRVSTFAPVGNVPVSGDYLVGPGDELKVFMWGRINHGFDLEVQRDGTIAIPGIGPLQVAGLTFAQAKKLIEERAGQITGVQVDVTMGRLRTIQVFVIGEVSHPGPFTVSSLSHVSNVLVACGGITKIGSLRKIELRRGNQLVKVLDLYDVLMRGSTEGDQLVQPNDVIFVPVIGPVAAVTGDVKRPAIYELRGTPTELSSVLKLSGGISAFGYSQRIQVERVENHQRRIVLDTSLENLRAHQFSVNDGDLVKVYPVLPQRNEVVTVRGNVYRPGRYEWRQGMRVADLVHEAEGLAPRTFMQYAVLRRETDPNRVVHIVPVDLGAAMSDHLSGPANIALQNRDVLTVFNLNQIRDLPTVQVFGEVRNPGFYRMNPGMRVSDLVYIAGGLKDDAYLAQAQVARTQVVNGSSTRHTYMDIDLRAALEGSEMHNPQLQNNDQLFVWRASNWHLPWAVEVSGEVLRPGPYTFHEGERLASLLQRCGGMLPDAYLPGTVFIRHSVKELEQKSLDESRARLRTQIAQVQLMPKQPGESEQSRNAQTLGYLEQVLDQSTSQQASGRMVVHLRPLEELARSEDNVSLEDQDEITIPRRPSAVNVLGQVYHPTALVYGPELTMREYLERAGGPTEGADEDHIFVFKADGSILTDEGIRNSGKAGLFPLLPVLSGGLMKMHLDPGDTVYVPEKLILTGNLQYITDVSQIIASTIETVAVLGIIATR